MSEGGKQPEEIGSASQALTAIEETGTEPDSPGPGGKQRLRVRPLAPLGDVARQLDERKGMVTVLLFAFLVLKVIVPAKDDLPTALGILQTTSLASTVAGALLSGLPLLAVAVLGAMLYWEAVERCADGWGVVLAALLICMFVTPWPILVAILGSAPLAGWTLRLWRQARDRPPRTRSILRRQQRRVPSEPARSTRWPLALLSVILHLIVLLVAAVTVWNVLYSVWLPHEAVFLKSSRVPEVGYVLDDSGGWLSMLRTGQRTLIRFQDDDVRKRVVCRKSGRGLLDTSSLSLGQEAESHFPSSYAVPVQECPADSDMSSP